MTQTKSFLKNEITNNASFIKIHLEEFYIKTIFFYIWVSKIIGISPVIQ